MAGDWRGVAEVLARQLTEDELGALEMVAEAAIDRPCAGWPTDPAWRQMWAQVAAESRRDAARAGRVRP